MISTDLMMPKLQMYDLNNVSKSIQCPERVSVVVSYHKIGHFNFENRVSGQPIDLVSAIIQKDQNSMQKCLICNQSPFSKTYKVVLEWGDSKNFETISEVCENCLDMINHLMARNMSPRDLG